MRGKREREKKGGKEKGTRAHTCHLLDQAMAWPFAVSDSTNGTRL